MACKKIIKKTTAIRGYRLITGVRERERERETQAGDTAQFDFNKEIARFSVYGEFQENAASSDQEARNVQIPSTNSRH